MATYLGFEILEVRAHGDATASIENPYERRGQPFQRWSKSAPARTRSHLRISTYQAGPAERKAVRDFYAARKGALTPFWMESHKDELELALEGAMGTDTITVRPAGLVVGLANIARHVIAPLSAQPFKIQGPTEAEAGTTLTVSPVLSQTLPPGSKLRFLYLVRFQDRLDFAWTGRYRFDALGAKHRETSVTLDMTELQRETP